MFMYQRKEILMTKCHASKVYNRKIRLLAICHASNSKFYKNIFIYIIMKYEKIF